MPFGRQDPGKAFADVRKRWAKLQAQERALRSTWARLRASREVASLEEFCAKELGRRWPRPREMTGGENVWEVARAERESLDFAEEALRRYAAYLDA